MLLPNCGPLPQISHTCAMTFTPIPYVSVGAFGVPKAHSTHIWPNLKYTLNRVPKPNQPDLVAASRGSPRKPGLIHTAAPPPAPLSWPPALEPASPLAPLAPAAAPPHHKPPDRAGPRCRANSSAVAPWPATRPAPT